MKAFLIEIVNVCQDFLSPKAGKEFDCMGIIPAIE